MVAAPLGSVVYKCGTRVISGLAWRSIQKFEREPLADYLLEKNPSAGTKIQIDVDGEKLKMMEA